MYNIISSKLSNDSTKVDVVFCVDPCRRTVFIRDKSYFLSFPKIEFEFEIYLNKFNNPCDMGGIGVYFVLNNKKYLVPLPNIDYDYLCLGAYNLFDKIKIRKILKNLDQIVDKCCQIIIERFWQSQFTNEYLGNTVIYFNNKKKIVNYDYWQKETKNNINWRPTAKHLVKA